MTKQEFFAMLDEAFKGSTLEEMAENLTEMWNNGWVKEYHTGKIDGMLKCPCCGLYSKEADFPTDVVDEEREDDYYGKVLVNVTVQYYTCPKCGIRSLKKDLKYHLIKHLED